MDNRDKRNAGVPLGTFAEQGNNGPLFGDDDPNDFAQTRPGRKRVRTLLGVPLAELGERKIEDDRTEDISDAIAQMLDGQSAMAVGIEADSDEIPLVSDAELTELPDSVPPGSDPLDLADETTTLHLRSDNPPPRLVEERAGERELHGSETHPLPVLIPSHVLEAQAHEQSAASAAVSSETVSPPSAQDALAPSSLAPREISRPATKLGERRNDRRNDATPALGFITVAAMALIGIGFWWATAGTFKRTDTSQAAASQPPAPPKAAEPPLQQQAPSSNSSLPQLAITASPPPSAADSVPGKSKASGLSHRAPRVKTASAAPAPDKDSDLPEAPSRAVVLQKLESVRSSVRACAAGRSGVADLDITVAHSGVVTHVLVGGDFAGTTQGSCIARAVREARFPKFKQERFRLLFPYPI